MDLDMALDLVKVQGLVIALDSVKDTLVVAMETPVSIKVLARVMDTTTQVSRKVVNSTKVAGIVVDLKKVADMDM